MMLTINESRSYHCVITNELHTAYCVYEVGDHMLTWRLVKFKKVKGVVNKTEFAFAGP